MALHLADLAQTSQSETEFERIHCAAIRVEKQALRLGFEITIMKCNFIVFGIRCRC